MKAVISVRVNTTDQHMESQLYDLREFAAKRRLESAEEYQDCGVSGRRTRRPGLDALTTGRASPPTARRRARPDNASSLKQPIWTVPAECNVPRGELFYDNGVHGSEYR